MTPEPIDIETRRVVNMMCNVKPREDGCDLLVRFLLLIMLCISFGARSLIQTFFNPVQMTILLRMDDKMNRQLTCQVSQDDSATMLSHELVHLGFIHEVSIFFK